MKIRLDYQPPYDWPAMLGFFAVRAISGLETVSAGVYSRNFRLHGEHGSFSISAGAGDWLELTLYQVPTALVPEVIVRVRRMFDLNVDLLPIHRHLATDPLLAPLIAARPGVKVPGAWDGLELAIRAVLGQQITLVAAIKLAGKLVERYGARVASPVPGLSHLFPEAAVLAQADLATLGMPRSRGRTLSGVAQALLDHPRIFDPGPDLRASVSPLLALWGVGEWTAQYIALRQMRHADAFPVADVGLLNALSALEGRPVTAAELLARAEPWRPYRGYGAQLLWTFLSRAD